MADKEQLGVLPSPTELMLTVREMTERGIEVDLGPVIDISVHAAEVAARSAVGVADLRAYSERRRTELPLSTPEEEAERRQEVASLVATLL